MFMAEFDAGRNLMKDRVGSRMELGAVWWSRLERENDRIDTALGCMEREGKAQIRIIHRVSKRILQISKPIYNNF